MDDLLKSIATSAQQSSSEVQALWRQIPDHGGCVSIVASDKVNRPGFVGLQALVEREIVVSVLEDGAKAVGVIHTQLPATPLRTTPTDVPVASAILEDSARLKTVTDRAVIIREYLASGASLVAAFDENAQAIPNFEVYEALRAQYPNLAEHKLPAYDPAFSGASYLVQPVKQQDVIFFAIQASQAHNPGIENNMTLCLGGLSQPELTEQFEKIDSYLAANHFDFKGYAAASGVVLAQDGAEEL